MEDDLNYLENGRPPKLFEKIISKYKTTQLFWKMKKTSIFKKKKDYINLLSPQFLSGHS
jgi:hypothetical protein